MATVGSRAPRRRSVARAGALVLLSTWLPEVASAQSAADALQSRLAFAAAETRARTPQVCTAATMQAARECALAKCRAAGGGDCRVTALCQPAQWSGSLAVSLQGGGRVSLMICGVPSRPGLIARLKDVCRSYRARGLDACLLETAWTPGGDEERANLRWSWQALGWSRQRGR